MTNTSLTADMAVTVKEIETEAVEILWSIVSILEAVEAYSAVSRIKDNRSVSNSYPSEGAMEQFLDDGYRLRCAVEAVSCMEFAGRELHSTFERRKMSLEPHKELEQRFQIVSKRLYRTLWDLSKSREDKTVLKSIIDATGVPPHMNFWEDIPSPWASRSYEQMRSPLSGMAVFSHCCGFTFIEYLEGKAQARGWTVPLDVMDDAISMAKTTGIQEAKNYIT